MGRKKTSDLRRGWTTGACATAAVKAGLAMLWGHSRLNEVGITLPRGEKPVFPIAFFDQGSDWVSVGITKDAGDDPDVTHGALIVATVRSSESGVVFKAGEGVGTVTKEGLPIGVGEPSINPVPREMMTAEVDRAAALYLRQPNVEITVSIPGGAEIAKKTWNGRLGIIGGLSILGTTGVVRPFSCAAWIASIHRGIDVARAERLPHVAGCTGATSERIVQNLHNLPEIAMLDMGDFFGGMAKYLVKHPVPRVTIGGGIGKITKLAQGAIDLHSSRSQVDFRDLQETAEALGLSDLGACNTALEAAERGGPLLCKAIAARARMRVLDFLPDTEVDVIVIDRAGVVLGHAK
ncbi:MAG: cobalt-precorrin-5B (C(1))-methyltransferase [Pseudomonadota bacterium]